MNNDADGGRVDFDRYADDYEGLLQNQLAFFSKDRGYFSEYKVQLVADVVDAAPSSILDFGCGIGLSLPYLAKYFPDADVYATDLSEKSLLHVGQKHPRVKVVNDSELDDYEFDMIFIAGVIHHVQPQERQGLMNRLGSLLGSNGKVFIFEHNPLNPVTRRMVSTCPFDSDAVLLGLSEMKRLVRGSSEFEVAGEGYCLFFPESLRALSSFEKWLRWLPMGGQYFVVGSKT